MAVEKRLQHLALDENGKLIDVRDITDRDKPYYCPSCKQVMIARMGSQRKWHFAHKHTKEDYDNYLHTIAEMIISECFDKSEKVPLILRYNEICDKYSTCPFKNSNYCSRIQKKKINLKEWIDSCQMEQGFTKDGNNFRADIFCHNSKNESNPIFIEIYVTHQCEPKKINSGIKIIEFKIESEEDIFKIIDYPIQEGDDTKFYNFNPKDKIISWNNFSMPMKRFTLFNSGKAHLDDITCHEFNLRRGVFELTINMDYEEEETPIQINDEFWSPRTSLFPLGFILARKYYPNAKHCHICRWHTTTMSLEHICKLYKKCHTNRYCSENNPLTCPYFQVNSDMQMAMEELYNQFSRHHFIDLWRSDIPEK